MCEIFGVSSRKSEDRRAMLREFFSHSDANPHGWGIADLSGGDLRICEARQPLMEEGANLSE